jgi:polyhydroxybutyrate depolymerase
VGRFAFCCLFLLAMASGVCAETRQLTVDGAARTFLLVRPAGQAPHPTIIVLHGGNGDADEEMRQSGLGQHGAQQGFATVFPQAKGGYWNFFPPGKENGQYKHFFKRLGGVPNDVAFLKMVVADLVKGGIADPKRIYLIGRSLGGVMALQLACVDAGSFAAIGVLISTMPDVTGSECKPAKPMPVLIINGTDDRVLPYRGERGRAGDVLWSTQRLVGFFRALNGCAEPAQQSVLPGKHVHKVLVERSTGCTGAPVVLYTVVGGGHELPPALNASRALLDFLHDKMR